MNGEILNEGVVAGREVIPIGYDVKKDLVKATDRNNFGKPLSVAEQSVNALAKDAIFGTSKNIDIPQDVREAIPAPAMPQELSGAVPVEVAGEIGQLNTPADFTNISQDVGEVISAPVMSEELPGTVNLDTASVPASDEIVLENPANPSGIPEPKPLETSVALESDKFVSPENTLLNEVISGPENTQVSSGEPSREFQIDLPDMEPVIATEPQEVNAELSAEPDKEVQTINAPASDKSLEIESIKALIEGIRTNATAVVQKLDDLEVAVNKIETQMEVDSSAIQGVLGEVDQRIEESAKGKILQFPSSETNIQAGLPPVIPQEELPLVSGL